MPIWTKWKFNFEWCVTSETMGFGPLIIFNHGEVQYYCFMFLIFEVGIANVKTDFL